MTLFTGEPLTEKEVIANSRRQDRCMWCGGPGVYGEWPHSGKRMLASPVSDGDLILDEDGYWREYDEDIHTGQARFRSHWASCPKGDEARRADVDSGD